MYQRVEIYKDYKTPEHAGAGELFQIISVTAFDDNENETDLTAKVDQGKLYHEDSEVLSDLSLPIDTPVESEW